MDKRVQLPPSTEQGSIPVFHLRRLWEKHRLQKAGKIISKGLNEEWSLDHGVLNAVGVSLEDALQFMYTDNVSFNDFERWILEKNNHSLQQEKLQLFNQLIEGKTAKGTIAEVLSPEEVKFFHEYGYIILRNAVSPEDCKAAAAEVWQHLGADPSDSSTWYNPHPDRKGIMINFYHHPAFEKNRRSEKIRMAFAQLFGHQNLIVTTDRVSFNPPETNRWKFPWPNLHWDADLRKPVPFGLQGLLYLSDTSENQGAFRLVPGFHHRLDEWLKQVPPGNDPQKEDLESLGPKRIAANAGDFIIWHQALPHGSGPNTHTLPRIVQYITWQEV